MPINADLRSDWSRQDPVVASKTWRVWPDRIFLPLPLFARACAFTEYGLVHETSVAVINKGIRSRVSPYRGRGLTK